MVARGLARDAKSLSAHRRSFAMMAGILALSAVVVFPRPRGDDLAEAYFHEALAFRRAADYRGERRALETVLKIDPDNVLALVNLGIAGLVNLQEPDLAVASLQRAVDLAPDDTKALYNLAMAYDTVKEPAHAKKYFLAYFTAVAADSLQREDEKILANAHRKLAAIYEREREYPQSLAEYRAALDLTPSDPRLWAGFGRIHIMLREFREAEEAINKALALDKDYAYARELLEYLQKTRMDAE